MTEVCSLYIDYIVIRGNVYVESYYFKLRDLLGHMDRKVNQYYSSMSSRRKRLNKTTTIFDPFDDPHNTYHHSDHAEH